jgi:hypothetical protein
VAKHKLFLANCVKSHPTFTHSSLELKKLSSPLVTFEASDSWLEEPPTHSSVMAGLLVRSLASKAKQKIHLKVGAQVMLSRNDKLEKKLVNGSRGVVVGFQGDEGVKVKFDNGMRRTIRRVEYQSSNPNGPGVLARKQVPLQLAWATTIHKSQGSTLTRASLSINDAFDYGQAYVALSRVRGIEGLWMEERMKAGRRWCEISPRVLDFYGLGGPAAAGEREGGGGGEERGGEEEEIIWGGGEGELEYVSIDTFGTPIYNRRNTEIYGEVEHFDFEGEDEGYMASTGYGGKGN